jgi:hypothetical protein
MQTSRIVVTLMAMLILLAVVALEIDRQSRHAARGATRAVGVSTSR